MKTNNNSKIFATAIISTFIVGVISFGSAIKHDYQNLDATSHNQPTNYLLFR